MPHFNIYCFIVGFVIIAAALYIKRRDKMRRAVFENLDSAYQNGAFEQDGSLHNALPDEIAYDLTCYSPEFDENNTRPKTLTPYVRQWLRQKGL